MIDETVIIEGSDGSRRRVPVAALNTPGTTVPGDMLVLGGGRRDDPPPPLPINPVVVNQIMLHDADGNTLELSVNVDVDPLTRSERHVRYLIVDQQGCRTTYFAAPDQALAVARAVVAALEVDHGTVG